MPAIVGSVKIISVSSSSIVHIGDAIQLAPHSATKTFAGAGSFITGDNSQSFNTVSATNTYESGWKGAAPRGMDDSSANYDS